jgi:hypothetical protein
MVDERQSDYVERHGRPKLYSTAIDKLPAEVQEIVYSYLAGKDWFVATRVLSPLRLVTLPDESTWPRNGKVRAFFQEYQRVCGKQQEAVEASALTLLESEYCLVGTERMPASEWKCIKELKALHLKEFKAGLSKEVKAQFLQTLQDALPEQRARYTYPLSALEDALLNELNSKGRDRLAAFAHTLEEGDLKKSLLANPDLLEIHYSIFRASFFWDVKRRLEEAEVAPFSFESLYLGKEMVNALRELDEQGNLCVNKGWIYQAHVVHVYMACMVEEIYHYLLGTPPRATWRILCCTAAVPLLYCTPAALLLTKLACKVFSRQNVPSKRLYAALLSTSFACSICAQGVLWEKSFKYLYTFEQRAKGRAWEIHRELWAKMFQTWALGDRANLSIVKSLETK